MAKQTKFKVGDRAYFYDENRRKYTEPTPEERARGKVWGDIIYAEHYHEYEVVGVEGRSYLYDTPGRKLAGPPRKLSFEKADRIWKTATEKDEDVFRHDHAHSIADRVRLADVDTLRRVAALVGYDPDARKGR